jgi:hypothetical protein
MRLYGLLIYIAESQFDNSFHADRNTRFSKSYQGPSLIRRSKSEKKTRKEKENHNLRTGDKALLLCK